MPQVKTKQLLYLCFFVILAFFTGCSERNTQSPINPDTGHHSVNWLPASHMEAARSSLDSCSSCHGADFKGGISGISCTSCHLGSPTAVHPADWVPVYSTHGPYAKTNSTTACANQYCHGTSLAGVSNSGPSCTSCHLGSTTSVHPLDWGSNIDIVHGTYVDSNGNAGCANVSCHGASLTGVTYSGPSCYSCHLGGVGSFHPSSWGTSTTLVDLTHADYVKTNGSSACANAACHGTDLSGVTNSGPACVSCHVNGFYPFTTTGCVSCHGQPPDGAVYPNIAGKHAKHMQLNGITCAACHARSSDQHSNGTIEVVFDATYNAKSGIATYNPTTKKCSNISCHGSTRTQTSVPDYLTPQSTPGQTPDWITGTIDVKTQCTACHVFGPAAGSPENNSYWSGRHYTHVWDPYSGPQPKLACTACHDTDKLAVNHLTALNTIIMEGPASATIVTSADYKGSVAGGSSYCSSASCHSDWGATW